MNEWIDVNDRLPDEHIDVLVFGLGFQGYGQRYAICDYVAPTPDEIAGHWEERDGYSDSGEWAIGEAQYWMPLPDAPE